MVLSLGRRGHLFDYTCATIIYEMCVVEPTATVSLFDEILLHTNKFIDLDWVCLLAIFYLQVTNVRHQEKPKYPPYPLSTIELEKRASRYFRMSSEKTMKVSSCLTKMCFITLISLSIFVVSMSS